MKFEMLFKSMLPSNFIGRRGLVLIRTMKKVFKYQFLKKNRNHKYVYLNIS